MSHRLIEPLESRQLLAGDAALVRGNVFRDLNRNAVRDAGEPAQPNIRVYLDYNNSGTRDGDVEPISITNATGGYRFEAARAPATIAVRLLLVGTGWLQTRPTDNAARTVTTTVGGNFELESFGVMEPAPVADTVLTGLVYTDRNRNGTRQDGEPGRRGVRVYLDTNDNGTRQDGEPLAETNGDGRYRFANIDAGAKTIRLLLTGTNLEQTQPTDGRPVRAVVVANRVTQADAFGVAERIVVPTTAIVRGTVFYDANDNAARDDGERGRANVRVYLDLDNDAARDDGEPTARTNAQGRYVFERAPVSGELRIRLDLRETNLTQTLPTGNGARVIATVAGQTYVDQNFGVREVPRTGTIRGRVFNDVDRDGALDDGERGVAGRSVYLDVNGNGERDKGDRRTVTNGDGRYVFERVLPGTYAVRLHRNGLMQTSPPNNGGHTAVVVAGATVGELHFGTYRPSAERRAVAGQRERNGEIESVLA